jgi:hypothetical protein
MLGCSIAFSLIFLLYLKMCKIQSQTYSNYKQFVAMIKITKYKGCKCLLQFIIIYINICILRTNKSYIYIEYQEAWFCLISIISIFYDISIGYGDKHEKVK